MQTASCFCDIREGVWPVISGFEPHFAISEFWELWGSDLDQIFEGNLLGNDF